MNGDSLEIDEATAAAISLALILESYETIPQAASPSGPTPWVLLGRAQQLAPFRR